jgi:signal transduction histidine kinase
VRVQVWRNDRTAFVSVSDNGPGITLHDLPHIFDRFYRVDRSSRRRTPDIAPAAPAANGATMPAMPGAEREQGALHSAEQHDGAGLGLAIAQAIVRAHGGSLTVRSEPGVGTAFTVSLSTATTAGPQRETRI